MNFIEEPDDVKALMQAVSDSCQRSLQLHEAQPLRTHKRWKKRKHSLQTAWALLKNTEAAQAQPF